MLARPATATAYQLALGDPVTWIVVRLIDRSPDHSGGLAARQSGDARRSHCFEKTETAFFRAAG
jgi:hypothetical protein